MNHTAWTNDELTAWQAFTNEALTHQQNLAPYADLDDHDTAEALINDAPEGLALLDDWTRDEVARVLRQAVARVRKA